MFLCSRHGHLQLCIFNVFTSSLKQTVLNFQKSTQKPALTDHHVMPPKKGSTQHHMVFTSSKLECCVKETTTERDIGMGLGHTILSYMNKLPLLK